MTKISQIVWKKLVEIEDLIDGDFGEWENDAEQRQMEAVSQILSALRDLLCEISSKEA